MAPPTINWNHSGPRRFVTVQPPRLPSPPPYPPSYVRYAIGIIVSATESCVNVTPPITVTLLSFVHTAGEVGRRKGRGGMASSLSNFSYTRRGKKDAFERRTSLHFFSSFFSFRWLTCLDVYIIEPSCKEVFEVRICLKNLLFFFFFFWYTYLELNLI